LDNNCYSRFFQRKWRDMMKKKQKLSDMLKFQPAPKKVKDNVMEKVKGAKKKIKKNTNSLSD